MAQVYAIEVTDRAGGTSLHLTGEVDRSNFGYQSGVLGRILYGEAASVGESVYGKVEMFECPVYAAGGVEAARMALVERVDARDVFGAPVTDWLPAQG